ncbi:MAG TPA: 30S ribosomal protein S6 [Phycisphaerae bacterium]|nr:30S ribosomal protein S6 [Phycisphaerae bacterium]
MKKKYEAMFLFDPAVATDWDKIKAELDRLMERAEATVVVSGKWDERRLAYDIRGVKRAVYVLAYFEAEPSKIGPLERDVVLSESIVRCLVLGADHVSEEMMKEALASGGVRPADDGPPPRRRGDDREQSSGRAPAGEAVAAASQEQGPGEDERG